MNLYEIMVPCIMRGKPVRTRHHRVWDKYVYGITGGLTILRPSVGKWISPTQELYEERVIPVRIACTAEQMDKIARYTLNHYDQEAVLFYKLTSDVTILYREKDGN